MDQIVDVAFLLLLLGFILMAIPVLLYFVISTFCYLKDRFTGNYPRVKKFISGKNVERVITSPSLSYSIEYEGKYYGFDHKNFFEYSRNPGTLFIVKTNNVAFSGEQAKMLVVFLQKECNRTVKRKEREFLKNITKTSGQKS